MASPLVSIIVPTYNAEKYIAQTIECVLSQTFTNWELVITDDCSKDSTVNIIEKYAQKDERIKLHVLSNNSGAAAARNNSIEKSIGRYIAFLDGDDWWYPEKLEKQLNFMQQTHCEFCFTAFEYADENLNVTGVSHKPQRITYKDIKLGCNIGTPGVVYDTSRIGKMYMPDMKVSEDWSLWIRIIEKTQAAYSINEPLWKYRILSNSLSRNKIRLIKSNLNVYSQILGYSRFKSIIVFCFGFAPRHICKMIYNKIDSVLYVRHLQKKEIYDSQLSKMLELIECVKIGGTSRRDRLTSFDSKYKWIDLYKLSARHGVLAIAWDKVKQLPIEQQPLRNLKLQWALSAEQIEKRYRKQLMLASELAQIYNEQGISTIVLKGLAISGYYPVPEHRECGDLDCFLASNNHDGVFYGRYDEGNDIAAKIGAKVDIGFYKHSHINYKGLMVENHAFCTAIRGSRDRKALERHLQQLLSTKPLTPIEGTHLLRPCADFNALFLTAHSFGHFLTEGIKLRHILDWALLLKAEQNNIDWNSFYEWCDRMHYTKFVDALTAISTEYLGLEVKNPLIRTQSDLRDKVLEDVLFGERSLHNTRASKFKKRLMIIRNHMFGGWKYRELYEKSAFLDTMKMILAFFIERKPKI